MSSQQPSDSGGMGTPNRSSQPLRSENMSSPLFFPGSSPSVAPQATPRSRGPSNLLSSPLLYESSSPGSSAPQNSRNLLQSQHTDLLANSSLNATPRSIRRGDIHPGSLFSTPRHRHEIDPSRPIPSTPNALFLGSDTLTYSQTGPSSDIPEATVRVIWGTNVSIQESMSSFRGFLRGFKKKYRPSYRNQTMLPPDAEQVVYVELMRNMRIMGLDILNLDVQDLKHFPPTKKLFHQLHSYPQEIIPIMDQTIKDVMFDLLGPNPPEDLVNDIELKVYKVRPFNLEKTINMRDLNPGDIDKLICIKGLVLRTTPIIPDMKQAFFRCSVCHHTVTVDIDRGRIAEPTKCPREICGSTNSMQLIHNRSEFADKQIIKLQETPDMVPDGQTPHSVNLCVYDELVDSARAGDSIEVTGIFRCVPVRINPRVRTVRSLFRTYLDVVHIKKQDKHRLGTDPSTLENELAEDSAMQVDQVRVISEEEAEKIREVSQREDVFELLARSLAPSIYELEDAKKGILLQLFGGTNKTFKKGAGPRYRGDINILMCGDPSTAKSQILQYVHKIAPRGVYTSGKGSSAVGLTAYITRDQDTKQLVLESGALVLSDGGVCCIDEFDKMSDATRSILHEVMEQQTVTVAKAGIITTLNARTSILASANPIGSRYNPELPVTKNIDLPPTLVSRFDLIYLMLDRVDEATDMKLADHIVSMYMEDAPVHVSSKEVLPLEFLTSYITYARANVHPVISEAAADELVRAYVEMRKMGEDVRAAERRVTATTRQLESMIRLSEAHAKLHLRQTVDLEDVLEATRLIRSAIKDYATDPTTGKISLDLLYANEREALVPEDMVRELDSLVSRLTVGGNTILASNLLAKFREQSSTHVDAAEFEACLAALDKKGKVKVINSAGHRIVRPIAQIE
ncbi:MCM complex subunit Cdc21 [Schizosaccharomyces japonicus yFS275]|uniref:DNA replication licensing factor MCM4 n=1 Tax=Schizosaccharomyces japonicus (strain yFS275 / FY16936) TaxID=402676 RepID=B6K682_SCHJY|nr:MCM complex subunit Cdc21 [Schizosaccharomyces japonicus yFS275]EEB09036.1 MCM complex subunit Cdc21 [Schizosaccharomyces japonicus yFS275]